MTISEPMTLATDYALALVSAWLGVRLIRQRGSQQSRFLWGLAFLALALGAFLGGTWHGLVQNDALWKATLYAVGAASFLMVVGSAHAALPLRARTFVFVLAGIKFALYASWVHDHDEFIYVVIDTGVAFAAVIALHLWRFNGWMVAGVVVSVAAALVQASGFALHRHFNHNDLYHVIQIAAMFVLYRGAKRLNDY